MKGDWNEVRDGGLPRDVTLLPSSLHFSEIMQLPLVDQKVHEFMMLFPFLLQHHRLRRLHVHLVCTVVP